MTLQTLRNLVWYWLDDSDGIATGTGGYFTNTQVNTWLNNALFEVQKQLIDAGQNWYIKCQSATLIANEREYNVPSDFLCSHRLEVTLTGAASVGTVSENVQTLREISLQQQDFYGKTAGTPEAYVMMKSTFLMFPAPDQAYPIDFYYSYIVQPMTLDADVPDVPTQYQEYIAILAAMNGFIKDDRVPVQLQAKKDEYKLLMKQAADKRQQDQPRSIIQTEGDDYGGFYF